MTTNINNNQNLKYKQSLKNYNKKLTYTLSTPVTTFSPKLKQKQNKLNKIPNPKKQNKDIIQYDYYKKTINRTAKYQPQLTINT